MQFKLQCQLTGKFKNKKAQIYYREGGGVEVHRVYMQNYQEVDFLKQARRKRPKAFIQIEGLYFVRQHKMIVYKWEFSNKKVQAKWKTPKILQY